MAGAEKRRVRYAVIGAGNIAQVAILPAFAHASDNSELVALISGDVDKRVALAQRYRLQTTGSYDQLEQVLTDAQIDAVYITVPNSLHRDLTLRAARAGVHVLCEKPMAGSVADCQAMIEACAAARVKLMIAYRLHFEEANLRAIELVRSGELGEPRVFSSVFTQMVRPDDIRTRADLAGGALFDMGVYCINAVRNLFRDEPDEVFATTTAGSDARVSGVDETTTAILRFSGGRVAQLTASLGAASVSSYRVIGSQGDLRVEPAYDYTTDLRHYVTVHGRTSERTFKKRDQFAPEIVALSRAILEDHDAEPSGQEGLADVRIMCAIRDSAAQGKPVHLPPFYRAKRPSLAQEMHMPPIKEPKPIKAPSPSVG